MTAQLEPEFITVADHRRVVEAIQQEYRFEVGKMGMELARYRQALEEAGLEPPEDDAAALLNLWRDCAAVISTASEFMQRLGTAKELIDPYLIRRPPWNPS